jgi:hypothetical protein
MIDAIGGRKVAAALLIILIAGVTVALLGDIPTNFKGVLEWVFAAFVAGNVGEHAAAAYATPEQAPVNLEEIHRDVEELKVSAANTQQGVAALLEFVSKIPRA